MKRIAGVISVMAIICMLVLCLSGCNYDPYSMFRQYPCDRAEKWYCKEIDMVMEFVMDEQGNQIDDPTSTLTLDGEHYEVVIGFQTSSVAFAIDEDGDDIWTPILCGTWQYCGKNLHIQVNHNSVFYQYYPELVFAPSDD